MRTASAFRQKVLLVSLLVLITPVFWGCPSSTGPATTSGNGLPGSLYVTLSNFSLGGVLARIDLASGKVTTLLPAEAPNALADKRILCAVPKMSGDLAIVSADGSQKQVILSASFSPNYLKGFIDPQASPDGKYIAYSNLGDGGGSYVYIIDMQGNLVTTIGDGASNQFLRPVWGPNDDLYMQGEPNYTPGLYKLPAGTTTLLRIDPNLSQPSQPAVSRDGTMLACTVGDHVWTMKTDGSDAQQLTTSSLRESYPVWSPDGKWVAVYNHSNDITLVSINSNVVTNVSTVLSTAVFKDEPPASSSQMDWK